MARIKDETKEKIKKEAVEGYAKKRDRDDKKFLIKVGSCLVMFAAILLGASTGHFFWWILVAICVFIYMFNEG